VYLPGAKQIDATPRFDRSRFGSVWPLIVSGAIMSHGRDNAVPATNRSPWPVVVFSHGNSTTSFSYTTAIEDWVSHGYVVAAVEHPYIAAAGALSGGSVAVYIDRTSRPSGVSYFDGVELAMREMRQSAGIQAADLSFALDQLASLINSQSSLLKGRLDFSSVAAVGHSLGGQAAVRACQQDPRFKACVDWNGATPDGVFLQYPDAAPLQQPLLYVEATPPPTFTDQQLAERHISQAEWEASVRRVADTQQRQLRGGLRGSYKVVLHAPGINHFSFTEVSLNAATPEAEKRALHNVRLIGAVTRAFLDKYLKNQSSVLLDDRTHHPELVVTRYSPDAR
jgi:predicted dienelactone hydrolase